MQSLLDLFRLLPQAARMFSFDNTYMKLAIAEAIKASRRGEVPVGAVIVCRLKNEVISSASNRVIEFMDPTAHAEMIAIRKACQFRGSERLIDCDLYVTLEPCPMCAQAISFARIKRLYFGAADKKGGGVENGAIVFNAKSCHHKPEIYGDIMAESSEKLLRNFFKDRR